MLTDVRSRDKNLSQGDRIIRKEVERQVVLSIRIGVDDSCDVDDETDGLWIIDESA